MGSRYFRPRTTYDMKRRVEDLAEDIAGEEPAGFHDAITIIVRELETDG